MPTLTRIWAVAWLTFREATRKRVFFVLIMFGITLLSVFALMPEADATTKLRVLEVWVFRAMTLFVSIIAVFLAGFSLPSEVERRNIYLLASKPISKTTILIGKYVGFSLVTGAFLGSMAVGSVLLLRITQAADRTGGFALVSYPQHFVKRLEPMNIQVHQGAWWLRGPDPKYITLKFEGLDARDFDEQVRGRIKVSGGGEKETFDYTFQPLIRVLHPSGDRSKHYDVPEAEAVHNEWHDFRFPRSHIDGSGRLEIRITNQNDEYLFLNPTDAAQGTAGIVLYESSELFELNFAKAALLLYIQTLLVLGVSITASSILSGPISALLGIVVLLIGNLTPFIQESVHDVDLYTVQRMEADPHGHNDTGLPPWLVKASTAISKFVIKLKLIPDLASTGGTDLLLDDLSIPAKRIGAGLRSIGLHLLILVTLGCWLVRRRDFA